MPKLTKTVPAFGAYAFWGYDLFPYLLGGRIGAHPATGEWHRSDAVYIPAYGTFFGFKFCLEEASGVELMAEIDRLRKSARAVEREADDKKAAMRLLSPINSVDPRKAKS